jgi:hypothetical protein
MCVVCEKAREYETNSENIRARVARRRQANPAAAIFHDARGSDRKRGLISDLTRDAIEKLIARSCTYCGETALRMTLDRIDNAIGHLTSNIVPACIRCNYLRGNMPYQAWLVLVPGVRQAREMGFFGGWTGRARIAQANRRKPQQPEQLLALVK